MKIRFLILHLMIILSLVYNARLIYAYGTGTHSAINKFISRNKIGDFNLNSYLQNTLGFENGYDEKINEQEVWKWLELGGITEDVPDATSIQTVNKGINYVQLFYNNGRSLNHFHN